MRTRKTKSRALARGLGWFSIGLGLTQLLAGRTLARSLGISQWHPVIRALGAREFIVGLGILAQRRARARRNWLWGRVVGDAVDLALLGWALMRPGTTRRPAAAVATGSVAAMTALDIACGSGALPLRPFGRVARGMALAKAVRHVPFGLVRKAGPARLFRVARAVTF
jgi:hypothetical protein